MSPAVVFLPAQAAPAGDGIFGSVLFPLGLMLLVFFFLVIRPQQKRQKEHDSMQKEAAKGDIVVTSGGIHGKVVGTNDETLTLEIASLKGGDKVRIKVSRSCIDQRTKASDGKGEDNS